MTRDNSRRDFLKRTVFSTAALAFSQRSSRAGPRGHKLEAGQGVVDTTPPIGIEMAGFHRPAGKERRIAGIRKPTAARALVLRCGGVQTVIISLDICAVSRELTARVQTRIARQLGIPAANIRLCATHTHSMPTFRYFRQWGVISPAYMAAVEDKIVLAAERAQKDCAETELHLGKSHAPGASNNRTTKTWKTETQFAADSTDAQRWLDTYVHVLHFQRGNGKEPIVWYHFSAHPVCYQDDQAGPDWPGLVEELVRQKLNVAPSFLQGHCGDVNAGDADHWIGPVERTAEPVAAAIIRAVESARTVSLDAFRSRTDTVQLPLDMERFGDWLSRYRQDPAQCASGAWVDPGFSKDWFQSATKWNAKRNRLSVPLSAVQLGDVALAFHPSELYSCYGLRIQRDAPAADTIVVGYTDDLIGYLPDPNAYTLGEYSAITVPKILDLPPFVPTAGRDLAGSAVTLLKNVFA